MSAMTFINVSPIFCSAPSTTFVHSCTTSPSFSTWTPLRSRSAHLRTGRTQHRDIDVARSAPVIRSELTQNNTASEAEARMTKTIDSVKASFNTVRTGRASPSLLDRVMVQYYGVDTPLNQVASVSVSGTSTLVVEPYDKSATADVERALMESDVGLTPASDGSTIRLSVPPLTQERRVQLSKQVKAMAEDGRVALRNIRRDAVDSLKKLEKKKEMGKDESKTLQDDIQKLTDKYVKQIESLTKQKEADILKV